MAPVKPVQGRRGKKHKMEFQSPIADDHLRQAIDQVIADTTLPAHLKAVIGCMLEIKEQLGAVMSKNKELIEENDAVRAKNCELEKEVSSLRSQISILKQELANSRSITDPPIAISSPADFYAELERNRSVVIAGIKGSSALSSSAFLPTYHSFRHQF